MNVCYTATSNFISVEEVTFSSNIVNQTN